MDEKSIAKAEDEADLAIQKAMEFSTSTGEGFNKKTAMEQSKMMMKIMKDLKKVNESLRQDKHILNNKLRDL
jgi:hypothetical protein